MCHAKSGTGEFWSSLMTYYLWINLSRIEPLVYQGVAVFGYHLSHVNTIRCTMFLNRIQRQQEPENRYTKYVQRLVVVGAQMAAKLVPLCPNLKSLALRYQYPEDLAIYNLLFVPNAFPFSNLRRLSIQWTMLPPEHRSFYHPIFQGLTHLEIDIGRKSCWNDFPQLKNLTNLRLNLRNAIIPGPGSFLFVLTVAVIICSKFPKSLNYITFCLQPDHAAKITTEALAKFCCNVDTGKVDRRLLFDWSYFNPSQSVAGSEFTRHWYDFIHSWVYLPRCYDDCWRREELEIDNRNHMYGRM